MVRPTSSSDKLGPQGLPEVRHFQGENDILGLDIRPVMWQPVHCDDARRGKVIPVTETAAK